MVPPTAPDSGMTSRRTQYRSRTSSHARMCPHSGSGSCCRTSEHLRRGYMHYIHENSAVSGFTYFDTEIAALTLVHFKLYACVLQLLKDITQNNQL